MVSLKKSLNLLVAVFFASTSVFSNAQTKAEELEKSVENAGHSNVVTTDRENGHQVEEKKTQAQKVAEYIEHHLKDDYSFIFFSDAEKGEHYGFSLPVILIDNGVEVFMSSEFDHGKAVVKKGRKKYVLYHGKIYHTDSNEVDDAIIYDKNHKVVNTKPWDFSITKNVASLFFVTIFLFILFLGLAKTYKKSPNNLPKGFARVLEPLVIYVRDEMARPNIGEKKYRLFMPFLLSVFFLIFFLNLLGLTPLGFNVTGSITVTACLALFTFVITQFSASRDYWKHIFWMPGVPWLMRIFLAPIELLGAIIKPFSLMVRLFANITAGHSVVFGLIAVAFIYQESLGMGGSSIIALFLSTFLVTLEILIAFLQAFIFTMLSSLFIGMAVEEHEHH